MALEPKIAGEKWRRFHQDERVEPRSLIKSNWETSIWYRVYSPEKINRELQRGLGGLWERAGRSPAGRRQAWPARTHSLAGSPLLEAGEGQPASEATTHCGCLTVSAREESSQGRHCTTSKRCAFFSVLKRAWSAKHHFFPWFSRPLFPLTSPPHLTTALVNFLKLRAFPAFSIWVVFDGRSFQELTERISPPLPRGKFSWLEINQGPRSVKKWMIPSFVHCIFLTYKSAPSMEHWQIKKALVIPLNAIAILSKILFGGKRKDST